jgi:flagellar motor protein MotB
MKKKIALASLAFLPMVVLANTTETVFTLSDDMRSATKYFSKRNNQPMNLQFLFPRDFNKSQITYARPGNYSWKVERQGKQEMAALSFPNTASYAYLERLTNTKEFLSKHKDDPNKYFLEVDGSECYQEGCSQDESIVSVIVPGRFKVLDYGARVDGVWVANVPAQWKIVDNTYTFYRRSLKGASVTLLLEDAANYGYNKVSQSFEKNKEIEVSNEGNRIRVVMPVERLFDSGSAQMQKAGLDWIKSLSDAIADFNYQELRVEGHTDNIPIAKRNQQGYTSNWELSSARASNIVQFLISRGVLPQKLAAVGYADSHPLAPNDTDADRSKNRRIEFTIMISDQAQKRDSKSEQE